MSETASQPQPLVLIVDDDAGVRETLRGICKTIPGVECKEAADVDQAVALFSQHSFGLVITDLSLPEGTGFDVMKRVRDSGSAVPIILHSGSLAEGHEEEAKALGAVRVLSKPADANVLKECICKYLGLT